jgi:hypothetical protein
MVGALLGLMIFSCIFGAYLVLGESWISYFNFSDDYVGQIIAKKDSCLAVTTGIIKAVLMVGMAVPIGLGYHSFNNEKKFL